MLEQVLGEIHNWFVREVVEGDFTISGGQLLLPDGPALQDGQYLRVVGSVLNDGLHQWPVADLADEEFHGEVWALAVPQEVQDLAGAIDDWDAKNAPGPYVSESFGGYSYTRATNGATGQAAGWRDRFRQELNRWRKVPGCR